MQALAAALNVLCVEDEPDTRLLMRVVFRNAGFDVADAEDGDAALALVAHRRPDVVVTDLMMPGMDGEAFIAHLRANPATAHIPVVLVTGAPDAEDMGADAVVHKPFRPDHLVTIAETLLRLPPG